MKMLAYSAVLAACRSSAFALLPENLPVTRREGLFSSAGTRDGHECVGRIGMCGPDTLVDRVGTTNLKHKGLERNHSVNGRE